jgi:squalene-hopene/tetraprenyl-beta-curcumene cyclase
LEADSTLVADYVMLMHYIEEVNPNLEKKAIRWILNTQLEDGGWNIYHGGPSELNATVKCAFALQLAGFSREDGPLRRAEECLLRLGGLHKVNSYTRFYLGLFGQYPWQRIVSMPPELMFPRRPFILTSTRFRPGREPFWCRCASFGRIGR